MTLEKQKLATQDEYKSNVLIEKYTPSKRKYSEWSIFDQCNDESEILSEIGQKSIELNNEIENEIKSLVLNIKEKDTNILLKDQELISQKDKDFILITYGKEFSSQLIKHLSSEYFDGSILTKPVDNFTTIKWCVEKFYNKKTPSIEFDVRRFIIKYNQKKIHTSHSYDQTKTKNISWEELITKADFRSQANFWNNEYRKNVPLYTEYNESVILKEIFHWIIPEDSDQCIKEIVWYMQTLKYDWLSFLYFGHWAITIGEDLEQIKSTNYNNIKFDQKTEKDFFRFLDTLNLEEAYRLIPNESMNQYFSRMRNILVNIIESGKIGTKEHGIYTNYISLINPRLNKYVNENYHEDQLVFDQWTFKDFINNWTGVCRNYSALFNNLYEVGRNLWKSKQTKTYLNTKSTVQIEDGHVSNAIFDNHTWSISRKTIDITSYILFGDLERKKSKVSDNSTLLLASQALQNSESSISSHS